MIRKANRLAWRKHLLDLIDERRAQEGDPTIGSGIERWIVRQELEELTRMALEQDLGIRLLAHKLP